MASIELPILQFRDYQKPCWNYMLQDKPGLRAVTVWPRRNGKDLSAINMLAAKALQRKGLYFYIAPFANQVRTIIWDGVDGTGTKFLDYIPPELITRKLDQTMKSWLANGSIIQLVGSDNPDAIMGTNPLGIVFTEFSLHKPGIWEYMRPILAENGGWALFNGTPRGLNHFYRLARQAEANPNWFYQYLTRDDTGIPTLEAIEDDRRSGMPESLIQQEYYCKWTASGEDVYIPLDIVQPAVDFPIDLALYSWAPRIMGVDVAYAAKGDEAVIAKRQGRKLYPLLTYRGLDNGAFASRISQEIREFKPHVVFVDAGRGEGVISHLARLGHEHIVIPIDFGGRTYDPLYMNKKAEMWGRARDWFLGQTPSIPDDEILIRQFTTPTFELNEKNQVVIEPKKHMKKRGETSTDRADAVILTFAEEIEVEDVMPKRFEELGISQSEWLVLQQMAAGQNRTYDPLSYMEKAAHGMGDTSSFRSRSDKSAVLLADPVYGGWSR